MSSSLEDLFEQILHSEQKAEERKNLLNEVKTEILQCLDKLKEAEEDAKAVQGQIVMKVQQWNEEELQLKWLSIRSSVLEEQKNTLTSQQQTLEQELAALKTQTEKERDDFCHSVQEFCQGHDLLSYHTHQRELKAKDELKELLQEEKHLEDDLNLHSKKRAAAHRLEDEKGKILKQIQEYKNKCAGLDKDFQCKVQKTKELEAEKKQVADIPYTGEEFKRLQAELQACKDDTLEGVCGALQRELQELQQRQWQQNLQQRQPKKAAVPPNKVPTQEPHYNTDSVQALQARQNFQRFSNFRNPSQRMAAFHRTAQETSSDTNTAVVQEQRSRRRKRPNLGRLTEAVRAENSGDVNFVQHPPGGSSQDSWDQSATVTSAGENMQHQNQGQRNMYGNAKKKR